MSRRQYASAQSAVDAWARLTAALRNGGAGGYGPDSSLLESDAADGDPGELLDARRDLSAVFMEAERRVKSAGRALDWAQWVEHRFVGTALRKMSVQPPEGEDVDVETYAKGIVREVDDVVECVLDEKGMLSTKYARRREDRVAGA